MKKNISFIILTWNSNEYITKCLDSIENEMIDWDTIVYIIDNGSIDDTVEQISLWNNSNRLIKLNITKLKENKGTTFSRNIGLKKALNRDGYICVLDSDTQINKEAIIHMTEALERHMAYGIIGPKLVGLNGELQNSGRNVPTLPLKIMKVLPSSYFRRKGAFWEVIAKEESFTSVGYLMSACWVMRSNIVKKLGLLDENIFYAPEDVEYCMRSWKNGYKVVYDKEVSIIHAWQRLSRKKIFSRHNYEHIKGLLYLFIKYRYCFRSNIPDIK